jgi:hypothetical protein
MQSGNACIGDNIMKGARYTVQGARCTEKHAEKETSEGWLVWVSLEPCTVHRAPYGLQEPN